MKTKKIKVTIETEVPGGKTCQLDEFHYCFWLRHSKCKAFDNARIDMIGARADYHKCQACLDACEKANQ